MLSLYLSRNCGEVTKCKKVDKPNTDKKPNEIFANKVDADKIDGEEESEG